MRDFSAIIPSMSIQRMTGWRCHLIAGQYSMKDTYWSRLCMSGRGSKNHKSNLGRGELMGNQIKKAEVF